jgi:hypothetical protein
VIYSVQLVADDRSGTNSEYLAAIFKLVPLTYLKFMAMKTLVKKSITEMSGANVDVKHWISRAKMPSILRYVSH